MDPFTQRMLEKAEQRSKTLGISKTTKFPLSECENATMPTNTASQSGQLLKPQKMHTTTSSTKASSNKLQVIQTNVREGGTDASSASSNKVLHQFAAVDKENMDLGIQINITTGRDVEVEVEVEEQDLTDENDSDNNPIEKEFMQQQPLAKIRDTSRNRLQRLGALYSDNADLSSPIHRTEGKFHEGSSTDADINATPKKQRYGKLVALANTINQWEDDTTHHVLHSSSEVSCQKSSVTETQYITAKPAQVTTAKKPLQIVDYKLKDNKSSEISSTPSVSKTKQLKWDPKVLNSLEAQGFQRRESSTTKIAFEYPNESNDTEKTAQPNEKEYSNTPTAMHSVGKLDKSEMLTGGLQNAAKATTASEDKKPTAAEKLIPSVKQGLVSGRAALFENKSAASQAPMRPQKDPTELSLKERMQLFEKNKGEALIPKAAFGMAPSINKIRQDGLGKKMDDTAATTGSKAAATVKLNADTKVRNKVAELVANASTLSENRIKAEITKQRNEDMQVIANRFNRQKDLFNPSAPPPPPSIVTKNAEPQKQNYPIKKQNEEIVATFVRPPPPPPPPPPMTSSTPRASQLNSNTNKRRSPGDTIDESKRARKSEISSRLYPALSDLESNESLSDNDNCCTTATVSGHTTVDEADGEMSDYRWKKDDNDDDGGCCNQSYMDSEDSSVGICNDSLGREIMHVVQANENQQNKAKQQRGIHYADKDVYYGDSSMNSSEASLGVDDYLDEALDEDVDGEQNGNYNTQESDDEENSRVSRSSKGTTTSNSFSFKKTPKKYINCHPISEDRDDYQAAGTSAAAAGSPLRNPVRSALTVNQEDDNMVTLVHTVSFYRRQQNTNSNNSTPVRVISREQVVRSNDNHRSQKQQHPETGSSDYDDDDESNSDTHMDDTYMVQEKIKKLLDEVCKQQQVIGQTSQALNLCAATIEFSGSTESVEGERHLLVATHRRQAALDEVQRLRVENSLRPLGTSDGQEKGRLTVKDITIPLRQDYVRKLSADTISGHHLVCLLKYNEHVLATKTVPTLPGLLAVRFPDVLQVNDVYADFRVTLEIYGMTAQREVLPHDVKYHININNKKTPKKKGGENRLVMPIVQSPAGPHVVRTPALVQYGFAIFSLREIQRTTWTLTQVLGVSPLDGVVHMKVDCELSVSLHHKGFLTMFEDSSGCAWHRRWCHLNGHVLNYWKYPDDEKKKAPMGSIDLYPCITKKVATAPRDICARLNTMLLECQRPARDTDVESLLVVPCDKVTIVRHLLSADTKEERDEWCAFFNKALTLIRAWGPPQ